MSILGSILTTIEHAATQATAPPSTAAPPAPAPAPAPTPSRETPAAAPSTPSTSQEPAPAQPAQLSEVDVDHVLEHLAAQSGQRLNWHESIVDLLKLLRLDSSLTAREQLARELGYSGSLGTAEMNMWLHHAVIVALEQNGGKVSDKLKHANA